MGYIDKSVSEYIDDHYRPLNEGMSALREQCEADHIPVILRETENFLKVFLCAHKPAAILEIGTAYGYSAAFFAYLLKNSTVTTIERDAASADIARENIRQFGLSDRVDVITGDAVNVLRDMPGDAVYDFVFIDAGKSHYSDYLREVLPYCHQDTVIVCDNIMMHGMLVDSAIDTKGKHKTNIKRMNDFVDEITDDGTLDVTLMSTGDGIAVIRKK